MLGLPKRFVLFDLECTSWEGAGVRGWSDPGEHREVVQLGAIIVDTENFNELSVFKSFVKPRINPVLSEYLIELTEITQEDVDREGVEFPVFLNNFFQWIKSFRGVHQLYCFDSKTDRSRLFDLDVLIENCDLLGVEFPFDPEQFHNINELFRKHGYLIKQSGASPEAFGIEIPARPHNALNDSRGLLISLRALSERVK